MKGFAPGRVVCIAAVIAAATFGAIVLSKSPPATSPAKNSPSSFAELVGLPEQELAKVDIALVNLLCAQGLPGVENLDVKGAMAVLDQWADAPTRPEVRLQHGLGDLWSDGGYSQYSLLSRFQGRFPPWLH